MKVASPITSSRYIIRLHLYISIDQTKRNWCSGNVRNMLGRSLVWTAFRTMVIVLRFCVVFLSILWPWGQLSL